MYYAMRASAPSLHRESTDSLIMMIITSFTNYCSTTDVGIRVNLSSCQTFVDLVLALGKSLQSVRNHHHFPFTTVTDEVCLTDISLYSKTSSSLIL